MNAGVLFSRRAQRSLRTSVGDPQTVSTPAPQRSFRREDGIEA